MSWSQKITNKNIEFGLEREQHNKPIIEQVFNLNLTHSKYQYQNFDFFDEIRGAVVEHKSFHILHHIENHTLLKTNKICCSNSIFIFEFLNGQLFYLQYSSKIFKTLKTGWIKYQHKIFKEEFFIIPNELLTPFNSTSKIDLKFKEKHRGYIQQLILDDAIKSNIC